MIFYKMHGLQNDFIIIENMKRQICLTKTQIAFLCNRKEGIGADGLILVEPSEMADIRMKYFNSDGSIAQVCGNGLRCTAKYAYDEKLVQKAQMCIESEGRSYEAAVVALDDEKKVDIVCVNMGKAVFESEKIPICISDKTALDVSVMLGDEAICLSAAAFPNPHAVLIGQDWDRDEMEKIGAKLQQHTLFPQQVNVNFVIIKNRKEAEISTYERGVGMTMACGSGACATGAVLHKKGLVDSEVLMRLPGGALKIKISENGDVLMTGKATFVFKGTIEQKGRQKTDE